MTWIKTIPMAEATPELGQAIEGQMHMYPPEYMTPVESLTTHENEGNGPAIIMAHSLLPQTLYHTFASYGTLLSPDLPLSRKQHEMIAATVSSLNACHY